MRHERYKVGDLIRGDHRVLAVHRGHFGRVYICRQDLPGGNAVYKAIKTFRQGNVQISRGLFDRELAYWVQLPHHPNVVQAKDADTVQKFLVLEFVCGPNLRDVADHSPLWPAHFLRWAREIAAGLRFLHVENNFIHRDLRPANILIDIPSKLTAKISDLGIGKPFDPGAAANTVIGTFNYMAPEVFYGKTDFRSDIFSFGATLYYMATGRYAVPRSTSEMRRITPLADFCPGSPDQISDVILRCLDREPDGRYGSIADVVAELARAEEWPTSLPYRLCETHDYRFYAESITVHCPFCRWAHEFHTLEERLDRLIAETG